MQELMRASLACLACMVGSARLAPSSGRGQNIEGAEAELQVIGTELQVSVSSEIRDNVWLATMVVWRARSSTDPGMRKAKMGSPMILCRALARYLALNHRRRLRPDFDFE